MLITSPATFLFVFDLFWFVLIGGNAHQEGRTGLCGEEVAGDHVDGHRRVYDQRGVEVVREVDSEGREVVAFHPDLGIRVASPHHDHRRQLVTGKVQRKLLPVTEAVRHAVIVGRRREQFPATPRREQLDRVPDRGIAVRGGRWGRRRRWWRLALTVDAVRATVALPTVQAHAFAAESIQRLDTAAPAHLLAARELAFVEAPAGGVVAELPVGTDPTAAVASIRPTLLVAAVGRADIGRSLRPRLLSLRLGLFVGNGHRHLRIFHRFFRYHRHAGEALLLAGATVCAVDALAETGRHRRRNPRVLSALHVTVRVCGQVVISDRSVVTQGLHVGIGPVALVDPSEVPLCGILELDHIATYRRFHQHLGALREDERFVGSKAGTCVADDPVGESAAHDVVEPVRRTNVRERFGGLASRHVSEQVHDDLEALRPRDVVFRPESSGAGSTHHALSPQVLDRRGRFFIERSEIAERRRALVRATGEPRTVRQTATSATEPAPIHDSIAALLLDVGELQCGVGAVGVDVVALLAHGHIVAIGEAHPQRVLGRALLELEVQVWIIVGRSADLRDLQALTDLLFLLNQDRAVLEMTVAGADVVAVIDDHGVAPTTRLVAAIGILTTDVFHHAIGRGQSGHAEVGIARQAKVPAVLAV